MMRPWTLQRMNAAAFNEWQAGRHYLKRRLIKSKLLAHGLFMDGELVGGLLWATPHFTKKRDLFGMPGTLDKWEVLMLARFYLTDGCGIIASQALAESIGRGGVSRGSHRRGWRVQEDWVAENPPRFPGKPFVPRLLISWSDTQWGHKGTIYKASGWQQWDTTASSGIRTGRSHWIDDQPEYALREWDGEKTCWIMRLPPNPRALSVGTAIPVQMRMEAA